MLFPTQVDATRSVDEVFADVCTIFGDLPKLEKKRRKKCKDFLFLDSHLDTDLEKLSIALAVACFHFFVLH